MDNSRKNFSDIELETFLLIVDRYKPVIENKNQNKITNTAKANAWAEITAKFNRFPGVSKRGRDQLINLYKNLKKRGAKNQSKRSVQISNSEGGTIVVTSSNPVEERLLAIGAIKTPLLNYHNSDADYHKRTTSDTTLCENSCKQEESYEIIEVRRESEVDDVAENLFDIGSSDNEVPATPIPEIPSQEIPTTSFQSQRSLQSATNPSETPHSVNTHNKKVYQLRRRKRLLPASSKVSDSLIQMTELKRKNVNEQHEGEREKFDLEKEKFSMEKEKHSLEMRLLKEQLKMYELLNEKIARDEGVKICVNVNK